MEDMLIQSANMEIALWQNFGTARTANATGLLAVVVAVVERRLNSLLHDHLHILDGELRGVILISIHLYGKSGDKSV